MKHHILRVATHTIRLSWEGDTTKVLVILAHGVQWDMNHPLFTLLSDELVTLGMGCLRFHFPFKEKGLRQPDPMPLLKETYRLVRSWALVNLHPLWLMAGGWGLGARVISITEPEDLFATALFFIHYPLQSLQPSQPTFPPYLEAYPYPMLFIQGVKDSVGSRASKLQKSIPFPQASVCAIPHVDSLFRPRKRSSFSQEEVWYEVIQRVRAFLVTLPEYRLLQTIP